VAHGLDARVVASLDAGPVAAHALQSTGHAQGGQRWLVRRRMYRKGAMSVPLSVLDLSPILDGGTIADAFHRSRDLARHAERLAYRRFWLAEHHNMPGIASAATAVLLAHVGAGTSTLRIGAGGIMLPNHAPLQVAEQFGSLEALFPGRVDLGLGRAPGTDPSAARALRRTLAADPDDFPRDVHELMTYLGDAQPGDTVVAVPGAGSRVPLWILGSSTFGAQVAAHFGLPFAFASHFAPTHLDDALRMYRERFTPSAGLALPYVMLGVNVVAADTDAEAQFLASSGRQSFASLRAGRPIQLPPPSREWTRDPSDLSDMSNRTRVSFVGSADTVRRQMQEFGDRMRADELIVVSHIWDHAARIRSYELAAGSSTSR
jgi:luciferase family oxidoreductase group 1